MAKKLKYLNWIEDILPHGKSRKSMFGGFGYYLNDKLILVIFEDEYTKSYKKIKMDYALWNGCMFPVEREHHSVILNKFDFLINHPVLPKWLYLPQDSESFEENVRIVIQEVRRENSHFGVIPKAKRKAESTRINFQLNFDQVEEVDTRKPRMFSDEPKEEVLKKAKNISDLKNLGPKSENELKKAGIKDVAHFKKLGWKKALEMLVAVNPRNAHSVFAYALIGALQNKAYFKLSDSEKAEAQSFTTKLREKMKSKK
jgi:hypothetical protein